MKFKLTATPGYWWPVTLRQPSDLVPGQYEQVEIEVRFRRLDEDALSALRLRAVEQMLTDRHILPEVITDFRRVPADGGGDVPYSPETLAMLLAQPGVAAQIGRAFNASIDGCALGN